METTFKNIGLLFTGILLIVIWSFYHTFFRLFTTFNGTIFIQYFYQITFLLWFTMLAAQPILNRYNKMGVYKALKQFSYFLAPLVMMAIFYLSKEQYLQDVNKLTLNEAIIRQTFTLSNLFAFGALYIFALSHKGNDFHYKRYVIAGTLVLIGICLCNVFIVYIHFPFSMGVSLSFIITDLALLTLLANDKIYGHTSKPYLTSLVIVLITHLLWFCTSNSIIWQNTMGKFAQLFF
jgi:hypothetical protein